MILPLPGTGCHWKASPGAVISLLVREFRVVYKCLPLRPWTEVTY